MLSKDQWVCKQIKDYPKADKTVIEFIANVHFHTQYKFGPEIVERLFKRGYCWYFAHMLKSAFNRGMVCYCYNINHFVWLDGTSQTNDVAYDINGVYKYFEYLIPDEKLGNILFDYKHIPGKDSNMKESEIEKYLLDLIDKEEYAK